MGLNSIFLVFLGGGIGSVLRFLLSKIIPCLIFAVVAAAFYGFAYHRRKTKPLHQFSNEAIIFEDIVSRVVQ